MSLEDKIAALTLAVESLTHAVTLSLPAATGSGGGEDKPTLANANLQTNAQTKPVGRPRKEPPPAAVPPTPQVQAASEPSPTKATPGFEYDDLRVLINQLAQTKGRDVALAVLAKFGVSSGKELKVEQYAACAEAIVSATNAKDLA
jgi:hypothetical protein